MNIMTRDVKSIAHFILIFFLTLHNFLYSIFVLDEDLRVQNKQDLMHLLDAGEYKSYDSFASYLSTSSESSLYQVRIDPSAEHPTSRRVVKAKQTTEEVKFAKPTNTPYLVKSFSQHIALEEQSSGKMEQLDKYVVSVERTIPQLGDGSEQNFGIGIDVIETNPGVFQVCSIHDNCYGIFSSFTSYLLYDH